MPISVDLPFDLEIRLTQEASRLGIAPDQYALQVLHEHVPQTVTPSDAADLLQAWIDEEDSTGDQETGEYLRRALDEDRSSDRKLFPPELQGISW